MNHPDKTKNNFTSNKFDSLLPHCRSGLKKLNTDKVWHCQSVDKLKGVGQLAIAKNNELKIQTIADLQLLVNHNDILKVRIRGFRRIYDMALRDLPEYPPSSFKYHRKSKNLYLSRCGREMGGQNEVLYCNVKILLHHRPNSFHD